MTGLAGGRVDKALPLPPSTGLVRVKLSSRAATDRQEQSLKNFEHAEMNHYTSKNFALTKSVGFLLNKARNMIITEMDAGLKDLDITSQHMGILLSLKSGMATTPFELSKLLGIDTGLMTRMLDKLEEKKLLKRLRSVDDRRVINLQMTASGEAVAAQLPQIAPQVLNARVKNFTKSEFDELRRLLGKFIGDIE